MNLGHIKDYIYQRLHLGRHYLPGAGFCCVSLTDTTLHLVYLKELAGKPHLQVCESIEYENPGVLSAALSELVKKHRLHRVPCSWVLTPSYYETLPIEALPVPPDEFQAAIRWKIKDLLSFSVNDAVIDAFVLPQQKGSDSPKMMMVVAARLSYLHRMAQHIHASGLALDTIDIQELALRNLTALYEQDEKTSAFMLLQNKNNKLIITRQGTLYFSRRLECSDDLLKKDALSQLDKLSLEIQRSFDYFQSQWRHPAPARFFLGSLLPSAKAFVEALSERLTVPVQLFDLNDKLSMQSALSFEQQGIYLPLVGGALKHLVGTYAAN